MATIRKGASEADIQAFEKALKVKLPLPTRILYRFYDGQEFTSPDLSSVSLDEVIIETQGIMYHLGFSSRPKYVVVAASPMDGKKIVFPQLVPMVNYMLELKIFLLMEK